jgi:hypothetical protein
MSTNSPDDLDRHLSAYFRAQVPTQWPSAPMPVQARATPRNSSAWKTRLTLAASVAGLLGLGWVLSSGNMGTSPKPGESEQLLQKSTANGDNLMKKMPQK